MDSMSAEMIERIRMAKARAMQYVNGTPMKMALERD